MLELFWKLRFALAFSVFPWARLSFVVNLSPLPRHSLEYITKIDELQNDARSKMTLHQPENGNYTLQDKVVNSTGREPRLPLLR
jgi:hypothetical protein